MSLYFPPREYVPAWPGAIRDGSGTPCANADPAVIAPTSTNNAFDARLIGRSSRGAQDLPTFSLPTPSKGSDGAETAASVASRLSRSPRAGGAVGRCDSWLRRRNPGQREVGRRARGRGRGALPGLASARAQETRRGRVGFLRQQPPGEVLRTHRRRTKAAARGCRELAALRAGGLRRAR